MITVKAKRGTNPSTKKPRLTFPMTRQQTCGGWWVGAAVGVGGNAKKKKKKKRVLQSVSRETQP
jgi:hypothetical protein